MRQIFMACAALIYEYKYFGMDTRIYRHRQGPPIRTMLYVRRRHKIMWKLS